jgi:molecular chaperone DnaK (HSP70)
MAKIGIDFGTTNSLFVAYDKTKNEFTYFNFSGNHPIPTSSTVWYHDNSIIVGKEARENINNYAGVQGHHFEKSIKLKLGQEYGVNIFGEIVQPYKIASDIINHIKKVAINVWRADLAGVDINRAVFTIPINFDGNQRESLRKAASESGIKITTFIHEPFAAIIGYYFTRENAKNTRNINNIINELDQLNGKYLLTFDWGGGTLDITAIKVENGKMIEVGTSELTGKAGDKFDEQIANWAWSKFLNKHGNKYNEAFLEQKRKHNWDKLLARAERCKILLSTNEKTNFLITNIIDNLHISEEITRAEFSNLIENTLIDACNEIDKAIKEANISDINIDHVLLTGGTCYIPAVQEKIIDKFGYKVNAIRDAELLIAQGAAVISEMGWLPFLTKDISIQLSDDSLYPIFESGTNIITDKVAAKSEDLICNDNRGGEAKIIIAEGIGQRKDRNLAILKVPVLNNANFNDDIKLDAVIDQNIILKISARSLMVRGYRQPEDEYSTLKTTKIHQLSFGLDFKK